VYEGIEIKTKPIKTGGKDKKKINRIERKEEKGTKRRKEESISSGN
jgi:hypothetical protein